MGVCACVFLRVCAPSFFLTWIPAVWTVRHVLLEIRAARRRVVSSMLLNGSMMCIVGCYVGQAEN